MTRKADGHHQPVPLLSEARTFGFKARILACEIRAKLTHCIFRLLKKLSAEGVALSSTPEHVLRVLLRHRRRQRAPRRHAPSR